jgi:hypothetical protein
VAKVAESSSGMRFLNLKALSRGAFKLYLEIPIGKLVYPPAETKANGILPASHLWTLKNLSNPLGKLLY